MKNTYQYYNNKTLSNVAERLIESQNYDELRILSSSHKLNSFIGLRESIQNLDIKAMSIILEQTNFDEPNKKESALSAISINHFEEHLEHEYIKINKVAKYILKTQLDNKLPLNKICTSIINKIAALDLKELADKFYKEKIITDNDLEYLKKDSRQFFIAFKRYKTSFFIFRRHLLR